MENKISEISLFLPEASTNFDPETPGAHTQSGHIKESGGWGDSCWSH